MRGARGACLVAASLAGLSACRADPERSEAAVRSAEPGAETTDRGARGAGAGRAPREPRGSEARPELRPEPRTAEQGEASGNEAAENEAAESEAAGERPGRAEGKEAESRREALAETGPWGIAAEAARGGLRVREVRGPAGVLLHPGDLIVSVSGRPVRKPEALARRLAGLEDGALVLFEVRRAGRLRALGVQDPGFEPPPRPTAPDATDRANAAPVRGPAPQVIVVAPTQAAPAAGGAVGGGFIAGGTDFFFGRPPAFSAPGVTEVPGATFAPAPGTPSDAFPQLPGVAQPPGFRSRGPLGAPIPPSVTAPFSNQTGPGTPGFGVTRPDAPALGGARGGGSAPALGGARGGGSAPGVSIGPASAPPPGAAMPGGMR